MVEDLRQQLVLQVRVSVRNVRGRDLEQAALAAIEGTQERVLDAEPARRGVLGVAGRVAAGQATERPVVGARPTAGESVRRAPEQQLPEDSLHVLGGEVVGILRVAQGQQDFWVPNSVDVDLAGNPASGGRRYPAHWTGGYEKLKDPVQAPALLEPGYVVMKPLAR